MSSQRFPVWSIVFAIFLVVASSLVWYLDTNDLPRFLVGPALPHPSLVSSLDQHGQSSNSSQSDEDGNKLDALGNSLQDWVSMVTEPPSHPIDALLLQASVDFAALTFKPTTGLHEAAADYRKRRGRHPPPGFDKWVHWAEEHDTVMIEELFDQIYEDLEPFWGEEPVKIRNESASWAVTLSIRNGTVRRVSPMKPSFGDWLGRWKDLLEQIPSDALPDIDLAFNPDDEPHIFVPWERIDEYMQEARRTKHLASPFEMDIVSNFSSYPPIAPEDEATFRVFPDSPSEQNTWLLAREACQPDSLARELRQDDDFSTPPRFPTDHLEHTLSGFVANWTAAKSVCENPHMRNLHGYFVNPGNKSLAHWGTDSRDRLTTQTLFPILSSGKIGNVNNDILVPAATSWGNSRYFEDDSESWAKKEDKAVWRGGSSGQVNNEHNWTRFHRHRFVSMLNGTQVGMTEEALARNKTLPAHVPGGEPPLPYNFPMPNATMYPLGVLEANGKLGEWVSSFADAAFVQMWCWPIEDYFKKNSNYCWYDLPYYNVSERITMADFFKYKYLPDVDGHGYSGRWRAFLESDSVPIKATIWSEWHINRIIPWRHFVPMDSAMMDWWGIMDYFIGYQPPVGVDAPGKQGHDHVAKAIADQGRDWTAKVLRQEDMLLYFWRLILELARVSDDRRERMGWVDDLKNT